jgi:O-antigen/teichoic acid export membrane protein
MVIKDVPKEEFTRIFIKVGRLQFIIVSFIVSAFVAFGRQFIALWAGPEYSLSYYVALLTMIPVTIPLIQNTGINILYALNKHQFRSTVYLCLAVLNVALTFWWVEQYGIIGAAMATCIAYILGNILIINWYYHKRIGIDIPLFWKNILKMTPVMLFMGVSAWFILDRLSMDNWLVFFAAALVYKLLEKFNLYVAVIVAAIVCPLVNTGIFLVGCRLFFWETIAEWGSGAGFANPAAYAILGLVGANFLFEMAFNLFLSPIIVRLLKIKL